MLWDRWAFTLSHEYDFVLASTSCCDDQSRGSKEMSRLNVSLVSPSMLTELEVISKYPFQAAAKKKDALLHVSSWKWYCYPPHLLTVIIRTKNLTARTWAANFQVMGIEGKAMERVARSYHCQMVRLSRLETRRATSLEEHKVETRGWVIRMNPLFHPQCWQRPSDKKPTFTFHLNVLNLNNKTRHVPWLFTLFLYFLHSVSFGLLTLFNPLSLST